MCVCVFLMPGAGPHSGLVVKLRFLSKVSGLAKPGWVTEEQVWSWESVPEGEGTLLGEGSIRWTVKCFGLHLSPWRDSLGLGVCLLLLLWYHSWCKCCNSRLSVESSWDR
jgi:hypothetical protein